MRRKADNRRRDGGFTLAELIAVVVLLSIVAFVASNVVLTTVGASDSRSRTIAESLTMVDLMLRLAGVAVLLFGAGFWYMVELHEAGRLDQFRLGHFLPALNYSLFFAVFAVLGSREVNARVAVTVAALVSYALLALHPRRSSACVSPPPRRCHSPF
ncbi:MAG: prepilin-type N-terminal cleavage/methylation domain-containing protein [Planctomycetota bacterium]